MNFFRRLYSFEDNIDFRKGWRIAFVASSILVVLGIIAISVDGLNLGIDFRGGTSWQFPANGVSTQTVRNSLASVGAGDATIQVLSQGKNETIRVEVGTSVSADKAVKSMAKATGLSQETITSNQSQVGPSWGKDVSRKALRALIVFFIAVAAYISWRLEWRMAVGAIIAVAHDVLLSVAVYAIFQFEVTPGTVIAFLTILGYSLYDTIVVYDKVKFNERHLTLQGDRTYTDMMNLSLNQTIIRSLNTTLATILPVASILFIGAGVFGAITLREFGIALFVGLIFGAYSSIFIASPIVAFLKEREPCNTQIRESVRARRARAAEQESIGSESAESGDLVDETEGRESVDANVASRPKPTGATSPYSDKHPPRPRKQGKKR